MVVEEGREGGGGRRACGWVGGWCVMVRKGKNEQLFVALWLVWLPHMLIKALSRRGERRGAEEEEERRQMFFSYSFSLYKWFDAFYRTGV